MGGPIRFVFMILWFAIGLSMIGELQTCTLAMAGKASAAQRQMLSYGRWNRRLLFHK